MVFIFVDRGDRFELYLHDYMVKRKMHKTAAIFRNESNLGDTDVGNVLFLTRLLTLYVIFFFHFNMLLKDEISY